MNLDKLKDMKQTSTSKSICMFLSRLERQESNETTLESFSTYLSKLGFTIDKGDFFDFFVDLEDAGVGYLAELNGHPAGKFIWEYPIKDVIKTILNPITLAPLKELSSPSKKRRGRPKGSINRPKLTSKEQQIRHKLAEVTPIKPNPTYFIFMNSKGECIPFDMEDADKLVQQIQVLKKSLG